jgi:hypothetical protein
MTHVFDGGLFNHQGLTLTMNCYPLFTIISSYQHRHFQVAFVDKFVEVPQAFCPKVKFPKSHALPFQIPVLGEFWEIPLFSDRM